MKFKQLLILARKMTGKVIKKFDGMDFSISTYY